MIERQQIAATKKSVVTCALRGVSSVAFSSVAHMVVRCDGRKPAMLLIFGLEVARPREAVEVETTTAMQQAAPLLEAAIARNVPQGWEAYLLAPSLIR
jgi:hypothetical protein